MNEERKSRKEIAGFRLLDIIAETEYSRLYRAARCTENGDEDELWYAVKEYTAQAYADTLLEAEKKATQHIENRSGKSIVIPVLAVIESGGVPYAVMQYRKNGLFLSEMIGRLEETYGEGGMPAKLAFQITIEILESLQELHCLEDGTGYLHLDLHPGNIFFESADLEKESVGKVKFTDFSCAIPLPGGTAEKEPVWSVNAYSSPEQREGEFCEYCLATDLYSVAAILKRLLYGKKFYERNNENNHCPILEAALQSFFSCAMNYNPDFRYPTAQTMKQALRNLSQLNTEIQEQRYFGLLSNAYHILVPDITKKIKSMEFDGKKFAFSVRKLEEALIQNIVETSRCEYIFSALWEFAEPYWDTQIEPDIRNSLICSGIACSNNTGNTSRALRLFEKLQETRSYMPIVSYLGVVNRIAVSYADTYQIDKACELIEKNVKSLETIQKVYEDVSAENGMDIKVMPRLKELGRAYSARGTYLAMKHGDGALESYELALKEFGSDTGNRMITISHILNYACERRDPCLYKKYCEEYFGCQSSAKDILKGILSGQGDGRIDLYRLYLFLKGTYTFKEYNENDRELLELLENLLNDERLLKRAYHPVQLIYKYIGLIIYQWKREVDSAADKAMYLSMTCIREGKISLNRELNILMCITYQTMAIYNEITGQIKENEELLEILQEHCRNSGWKILEQSLNDGKNIKELLEHQYS